MHRWYNESGCTSGSSSRTGHQQWMIHHPRNISGKEVSRCRGNQYCIKRLQLCHFGSPFTNDFTLRSPTNGEWCDYFGRRCGHDYRDFCAVSAQFAAESNRFRGSNTTRDAQSNVLRPDSAVLWLSTSTSRINSRAACRLHESILWTFLMERTILQDDLAVTWQKTLMATS